MTDDPHAGDFPAAGFPADLELLPVPVIELTVDAHARQANLEFVRFTGIDAERLGGAGWFAACSPDRRHALFAALSGQADFELDVRMLRADGVKAWVRFRARWVGARHSFLCVLHDTTAAAVAVQDAQAEVQRFRLLADNVPALIAYYQRSDLTCVYANRQYAQTFDRDPQSIVGLTFAQVIGEEAARLIQPQVDIVLAQRRAASYVRQLTDPSGAERWVEVSLLPHHIGHGPVVGCFVLINDITHHRQVELDARESEERLSKFMDATVEGIAFHKDGFITDVNAPMAALLGWTPQELRGRFVLDFIAPEHLPSAQRVLAEGLESPYETALLDHEGRAIAVEIIPRTTQRGGETMRLVVVRDIRDQLAARERIRTLASHDGLTGLSNRSAFLSQLAAALALQEGRSGTLTLLTLDLDHFKRINDAYGQAAGDALLRAVASRVANLLPDTARIGRLGGDEIAVLLCDGSDALHVRELTTRLRAAVSLPVTFEGQRLSVTPTIGVAICPDHGADPDVLLRHASAAVRTGKRAGRDSVTHYLPGMTVPDAGDVALENDLGQALERGEFKLMWQPRVDAASGRLAALQAMVRWNHPHRGWLAPADFAGAAEHRHRMQSLASWALRQVLRQQRRWSQDGLCEAPLALDLGALRPHGVTLAAAVAHAMADAPAAPGSTAGLLIELDEQTLRDDADTAPLWLDRLRSLGAAVVIDEFGAQGVSLSALRRLPLAGLKIDHTLVGALPADRGAQAVTGAIIGMAHGLGMTVCAAGVESGEQQQWLLRAGCDQLQGAWVQTPMTAAEAVEWLQRRKR